MQKYLLYCLMIILLTGCYQSSASLLGPAITAGTSGNIYQAGLSYGTNIVVKETTGKTPSEHFLKIITSEKYKTTKEKIIKNKKKFDIIFSLSEIEHKFDPQLFIKNLKKILSKNGLIIFRIPNFFHLGTNS